MHRLVHTSVFLVFRFTTRAYICYGALSSLMCGEICRAVRPTACHDSFSDTLSTVARFPDMILSLIMVNIPPPTESVTNSIFSNNIDACYPRLHWVKLAYDELLDDWCSAMDCQSFQRAGCDAVPFLFGTVSLGWKFDSWIWDFVESVPILRQATRMRMTIVILLFRMR